MILKSYQRFLPILLSLLLVVVLPGYFPLTQNKKKQYVILKMDDLKAENKESFKPQWQQFIDLMERKKIKATIGIINETLETAPDSYIEWIKSKHKSGQIEFWHHGLDHKRNNLDPLNPGEFDGTPYTYQKEHFEKSMALAKEKLGISYKTFGAPYNKTDESFINVLNENTNISVWFFGDSQAKVHNVLVLERFGINLEKKVGDPDFETFHAGYLKNTDKDYLVLQGHPGNWDEVDFNEFQKVIDFLLNKKAMFVTANEYFEIKGYEKNK